MRRSATVSETGRRRLSAKSLGLMFEKEEFNSLSARNPRSFESRANASWSSQSSSSPSHSMAQADYLESNMATRRSKPQQNMFLAKDGEINGLLNLLHTNKFTGMVDPRHHAHYMQDPTLAVAESNPMQKRRLVESYHRSDGHLLTAARREPW